MFEDYSPGKFAANWPRPTWVNFQMTKVCAFALVPPFKQPEKDGANPNLHLLFVCPLGGREKKNYERICPAISAIDSLEKQQH